MFIVYFTLFELTTMKAKSSGLWVRGKRGYGLVVGRRVKVQIA